MRFSEPELRDLAGRATPLFERNAECFEPAPDDPHETVVEERLARWRRTVVGYGDGRRFDCRLAGDGLNESTVRPWLGRVRLRDDRTLPAWSATLNAILETCRPPDRSSSAERPADTARLTAAIPFEDILHPFVEYGWAALERRAGAALEPFAPAARDSLRRQLLSSLSYWAQVALGLEFRVFLAIRQPASWLRHPDAAAGELSRALFDRFVDEMLSGRLRDFLSRYPVLARLLATDVQHWVVNSAAFCRDLESDLPAIADLFAGGRRPDRVTGLQVGLSDPHNAGQSVTIVEFDGPTARAWKLVYKPKDLRTEKAFFELLTWLGRQGLALEAKTLRVLRYDGHGWVEHAEQRACADGEEASRYFTRAGMLLCLVRALGGTDFHFENVIACGEYPVLVDTETLMYHRARAWYEMEGSESADWVAGQAIADSVFATGLLPMWVIGGDGRSFDVSGLGAVETQETGYARLAWNHVNTDRMEVAHEDRLMSPRHNAPRLDGQTLTPEAYRAEFLEGFSEMHRCLTASRDLLTGEHGPLAAFRDAVVRYVLRPTLLYVRLAERLRHPDHLGDGADRSIEIEVLTRSIPTADASSADRFLRVYAAERESLENLDVPVFTARPEGTAIVSRGVVLHADFFDRPSVERVVERISSLDEDDHRLQAEYITATLHARYPASATEGIEHRALEDAAETTVTPLASEQLIASACDIAHQIAERAMRGRDGSVTWLSFNFDPATERQRLEPMGESLYGGRCGVALFLAALERVSGTGTYRDLALAALKPARHALAATGAVNAVRSMGLGGGSGVGGVLYALVRVGRFLGEEDLIHEACRLADGVTDEQVAADDAFDLIGGSAGAILGLLALADASRSAVAMERAMACGRHLLERRTSAGSGPRAWLTRGADKPLTGCAHGAAGIAYALLRLFGSTGLEEFRHAALEAIDYESSTYNELKGNWPDFRTISRSTIAAPVYKAGWCTGAPGIGLARIGGLAWLDTPSIRRDIEAALGTTGRLAGEGIDQLCCGNMGRMDVFLAGARLGRSDLAERAALLAARVSRRAETSGFFRLQSGLPEVVFDPCLFRGLSGIGYQLLRLADPHGVPSVLLWQ